MALYRGGSIQLGGEIGRVGRAGTPTPRRTLQSGLGFTSLHQIAVLPQKKRFTLLHNNWPVFISSFNVKHFMVYKGPETQTE